MHQDSKYYIPANRHIWGSIVVDVPDEKTKEHGEPSRMNNLEKWM